MLENCGNQGPHIGELRNSRSRKRKGDEFLGVSPAMIWYETHVMNFVVSQARLAAVQNGDAGGYSSDENDGDYDDRYEAGGEDVTINI
ncbi:hypothetical protein CYMTET_22628 [Cymbomonas tetramitiformis]|uniref:Uncharacterized protein n=1 Tax=Cymbomonas tetramitiformis TaxID=36881 RepID=A0AAE0L231_9CHLO|nr:hypothetical protein CYMTET_22628 [Cymbomonas tetramitiformis]